jgi:prepilin-type N-terminal cleavage/methylation domain-containing protein
MKRFVLGFKKAFTLIEVMIAVMIVSVVIAALFKLQGDTNHLFSHIQKSQNNRALSTFVLWNRKYSLEKNEQNLYRLVDNFDMDDNLRRELKKVKTEIDYSRVRTIETDTLTLEIGRTDFTSKEFDFHFNRVTLR